MAIQDLDLRPASVCFGRKDQPVEWLKRAYEEHDAWLVCLKVVPWFDKLRPSWGSAYAVCEVVNRSDGIFEELGTFVKWLTM